MSTHSRYWRKNRSTHEASELALSLRALRKVAGHLGSNVKPVFWKGMVDDETNAITLDPEGIGSRLPISHTRFDRLVGQVVAEGLASKEWREWVINRTHSQAGAMDSRALPYFFEIMHAAEDILIHYLPKSKAWSMYLEGHFLQGYSKFFRDPDLPPSPESLAQVWRKKTILNQNPGLLHFYYEMPLAMLEKHTPEIARIAQMPNASQRREARVVLYSTLWKVLENAIREWETFAFDPDAMGMLDPDGPQGDLPPDDKNLGEDEREEEEEEQEWGLDPQLAEEVNSLLEENESDVTQLIAVAVEDPQAGEMPTVIRQGVARSDMRPDMIQVKRLQKVFQEHENMLRKARRKRVRRGLSEGTLDPRRLHRVPLDGKVFKIRDVPGTDQLWHVSVVADASSSMSGKGGVIKPWPVAEKAFVSLATAARMSRNRLDIYAYHEARSHCILTRLNHSGELYTVMPEGKTPSGQAITAVAASMSQGKRRNGLIIHITDGASNCGLRLGDAVKYCQKSGIEVFTIGCGCNQQTKDFLAQFFPPDHLFFLRDIRNLSLGMERLLRRRLLRRVK